MHIQVINFTPRHVRVTGLTWKTRQHELLGHVRCYGESQIEMCMDSHTELWAWDERTGEAVSRFTVDPRVTFYAQTWHIDTEPAVFDPDACPGDTSHIGRRACIAALGTLGVLVCGGTLASVFVYMLTS